MALFKVSNANTTIEEASRIEAPRQLWKSYWFEGEMCCLYAASNLGKSVLAVQIADSASRLLKPTESVLYYDFELSDKQFQMRYSDEETHTNYRFANNFKRATLDTSSLTSYEISHLDEIIADAIEEDIKSYNAKIVIIDNISWLSKASSSAKIANSIMTYLTKFKRTYGLSILVLAHSKKRTSKTQQVTQDDLSGSKTFINFFDAAFAINASNFRYPSKYLKQIKVRTGEFQYGENHVEVCNIERQGCMLKFKTLGYSKEVVELKSKPKAKTKTETRKARKTSIKHSIIDNIRKSIEEEEIAIRLPRKK